MASQVLQPDCGRVLYQLKADQVLRMLAEGIIPDDEDVELFDGVLYRMTKGELHNCIVILIGTALRGLIPEGFHVREEKSARLGEYSLPVHAESARPEVGVFQIEPSKVQVRIASDKN